MECKYIFITGGVVSGLGKGITAASIGLILKSSGYRVDVIKFDPYLNVDPGTMSPYEHGEVYVLEDGSETDLDLGHYERFLDQNLQNHSSVTSGKIYSELLDAERKGKFLGKNVQLIPNVTNSIQDLFVKNQEQIDVRIIEIGGSSGDYEADIFLESIRQFKSKHSNNVFHIHLGYLVYLEVSKEYKTKPFQVSLKELSRAGLKPDFLVARYHEYPETDLDSKVVDKLHLFSNLAKDRVLPLQDMDSIYNVPRFLTESNIIDFLDEVMGSKLDFKLPEFYQNYYNREHPDLLQVGIVAKYTKLEDAYLSVVESIKIAANEVNVRVKIKFIDAQKIESKDEDTIKNLESLDAVVVPGGFGNRGMQGKIEAIKIVRENKIPFLGICLGLQMAVVEYLRNVAQINVYSREMISEDQTDTSDLDLPIAIDYIPKQFETEYKGGTMRLGGYECQIQENSLIYKLFKTTQTIERHRHRLEVQEAFIPKLEEHGMKVTGRHYLDDIKQEYLVEMLELDTKIHPYFVATQSHPEFLSRPQKPHPLFLGLLSEAKKYKREKTQE